MCKLFKFKEQDLFWNCTPAILLRIDHSMYIWFYYSSLVYIIMGYYPCMRWISVSLILMIKPSYISLYTDQDVCMAGQKKLARLEADILVEHLCLQFFSLFFSC